MKYIKQSLYLAATLELAGLAIFAVLAGSWLTQPNANAYTAPALIGKSQQTTAVSAQPTVSGKPRTIRVPTIGIDTSVQDGTYDAKSASWTISEDAAFYATMTDEINPIAGNTFVYGHNSKRIFGNLRGTLSTDMKAYVQTDNGYEFTYAYKESYDVKPDDVSKISPKSDKPLLILQTCSGLFNETRRLVYLEYQSYKQL